MRALFVLRAVAGKYGGAASPRPHLRQVVADHRNRVAPYRLDAVSS
jgi:hypothetical protein